MKKSSYSTDLSHLLARFFYPVMLLVSGFCCEEFGETHFHSFKVFDISSTHEMVHGSKQIIWRLISIPPNSWILSWLILWYGASHCPAARELYFGKLMPSISVSKCREHVAVVENINPHWRYALLEQTPSELHLQNSTRHTTLLWVRTDVFNDDFGRLAGTESLFRGVVVVVMDPFFITCESSTDKSITLGITDKLTTYTHSTLSLLSLCQFMRYRSTASVWFSKCINLAMYGIFSCIKFLSRPISTFLWIFFQNCAYIPNIP